MKTIEVKLLSESATMPTRAYGNSAGLDIYAAETITLEPQEKHLLKTDLAVNIPDGYVGFLTSRSGVSSKTDLVIETGKIDAGFQGEMKVNIKNDRQHEDDEEPSYNSALTVKGDLVASYLHSFKSGSYLICEGDKIAQLVIVPIVTPEPKPVEAFSDKTARGTNGWGSSDE